MNTIIAIWNTAGKGKSSTILELANLLIKNYPNYNLIYSSKDVNNLSIDFRLIIEINNKVIALESQGDPGTKLEIRLNQIIKNHTPNLIFCTCRTRGETVNAINNTVKNHGFDKVWTSTYDMNHSYQQVNKLKARYLIDLSVNLGLI